MTEELKQESADNESVPDKTSPEETPASPGTDAPSPSPDSGPTDLSAAAAPAPEDFSLAAAPAEPEDSLAAPAPTKDPAPDKAPDWDPFDGAFDKDETKPSPQPDAAQAGQPAEEEDFSLAAPSAEPEQTQEPEAAPAVTEAAPEAPAEADENDPLKGFSLDGLIDEPPAPEPAPAEEETAKPSEPAALHPDEQALKDEIESLGKILEESLELQEEIAQEKSLKTDPVKINQMKLARLLINLRWLMAGLGLVGLIYSFSLALFCTSGYIALLNLLYVHQAENPRKQLLSFPVTFAADLINITILVHFTGEINSLLFLLYFLLAAAITLYAPLVRALACTLISAAVYMLYVAGGDYEGINAFGISFLRSVGIILSAAWMLMLKYLLGYAREHLLPEAAEKLHEVWNKKITIGTAEEGAAQKPGEEPQQAKTQEKPAAPAKE